MRQTLFLVLMIIQSACSVETGPSGQPGAPCSTTDNMDGTWTLQCPGSDPITLQSGEDGPAGPPGAEGAVGPGGPAGQAGAQGERGETGEGGPAGAMGTPGVDGRDGRDGSDGRDGRDGTSCAANDNGDGSYTIICPGSEAITVRDGERGADGRNADPCTARDNGDGSYTINCPGSDPVTVRDGADAAPCVIQQNDDGSYTVACPGSEPITIRSGRDGQNAAPCVIADNEDGSYTITCPGNPPITVRNGVDGRDGENGIDGENGRDGENGIDGENGVDADPCQVASNDDGSYTITCPGSDPVTIANGAGCEVDQNGDGEITIRCGETEVSFSVPVCGNGNIDAGETCDDGNRITEACDYGLLECSVCDASCRTVAGAIQVCGDGEINGPEQCDDGNNDVEVCMYGERACIICNGTCEEQAGEVAYCGDGVVNGMEQCDDGDEDDENACSNECQANELPIGQSCLALLQAQADLESGAYEIDPDGDGPAPVVEVYCDMDTAGGGWTLILNRNVGADDNGQANLSPGAGAYALNRGSGFHLDINDFWGSADAAVIAVAHGRTCSNCVITDYDSALLADLPGTDAWSSECPSGQTVEVGVVKLAGPDAGRADTSFMCASTLGWGRCDGQNCHYGVHSRNEESDGSWAGNDYNELHFPSERSGYRDYTGNEGYCRGCSGGLAAEFNGSSTCCNRPNIPAAGWFTIWVR